MPVALYLVVAASGGVPVLEVLPSCHATAAEEVAISDRRQACVTSEQNARDQLVKRWTAFQSADRPRRVGMLLFRNGKRRGEIAGRVVLKPLGTKQRSARIVVRTGSVHSIRVTAAGVRQGQFSASPNNHSDWSCHAQQRREVEWVARGIE